MRAERVFGISSESDKIDYVKLVIPYHRARMRAQLHPALRLLVFFVLVLPASFIVGVATRLLFPHLDESARFLLHDATALVIYLVASWIMGRIEGRTIADYGLPWRRMFRGEFWIGAAIGFACISALVLALRLCGVFFFKGVALSGVEIAIWALVYTLVFVLVAVREEFQFRGYGLVTLTEAIRFWPAAVIWSLLFGAAHLVNTHENWLGSVNAALFGLLLCFLLRRTGNLWLPIGFHAAFDWGETYFYGVADSGITSPGHLLNTSMSGPTWLAGGAVGPEGSVVCTLLIAVTWLLCAWRLRPTPRPLPSDPPPLPVQSA